MNHLYIIRHCQAQGQAPDAPLTALGLRQADQLAEQLATVGIDYIVTSPYERAYRTIEPLALQLELEIMTDHRLIERVLCNYDEPQWREMLQHTYDDLDLCYTGGESSRAAMNRGLSVIHELQAKGYRHPAIVSHGNLISLLLKSFDHRIGFAEWEQLSNPDLYCISFHSEAASIKRIWI